MPGRVYPNRVLGPRESTIIRPMASQRTNTAIATATIVVFVTALGIATGYAAGLRWYWQLSIAVAALAGSLVAMRRWTWLEQRLHRVGGWVGKGRQFYTVVACLLAIAVVIPVAGGLLTHQNGAASSTGPGQTGWPSPAATTFPGLVGTLTAKNLSTHDASFRSTPLRVAGKVNQFAVPQSGELVLG